MTNRPIDTSRKAIDTCLNRGSPDWHNRLLRAVVDERDAARAEIERLKADVENLTESLAGEVTESERLRAEIDALKQQVADLLDPTVDCACGYDTPDDVCQKHYPLFRRLKAERDEARAQETVAEAATVIMRSDELTAAIETAAECNGLSLIDVSVSIASVLRTLKGADHG